MFNCGFSPPLRHIFEQARLMKSRLLVIGTGTGNTDFRLTYNFVPSPLEYPNTHLVIGLPTVVLILVDAPHFYKYESEIGAHEQFVGMHLNVFLIHGCIDKKAFSICSVLRVSSSCSTLSGRTLNVFLLNIVR